MMNSRGQFEHELRQLVELTSIKSKAADTAENTNNREIRSYVSDLSMRIKYYSAQESFMTNDIPSAFRHLILNYTSRLGAILAGSRTSSSSDATAAKTRLPHALEHLESLVSNDLKLSLVTDSNISKSLHNDFFLNLVIDAQSLVEWLAAKPSASSSDGTTSGDVEFAAAGDQNDENLLAGRVNACFLLNNLGILNFGLKKYALCTLFAKKALLETHRLLADGDTDGKTALAEAKAEKSDSQSDGSVENNNNNNNNTGSFAINKPLLGNTALFKVNQLIFFWKQMLFLIIFLINWFFLINKKN